MSHVCGVVQTPGATVSSWDFEWDQDPGEGACREIIDVNLGLLMLTARSTWPGCD